MLQHPQHAEALGRALAERYARLQPTAVLSPALGGVVIGHEVARALGVRALFAERQDGALTLRRGFVIGETDRVLVVEDVVTTGGSTRETMQVARGAGRRMSSARPRSSIAAARRSTCRTSRCSTSSCRRTSLVMSALCGGIAGGEAGIEASGS